LKQREKVGGLQHTDDWSETQTKIARRVERIKKDKETLTSKEGRRTLQIPGPEQEKASKKRQTEHSL